MDSPIIKHNEQENINVIILKFKPEFELRQNTALLKFKNEVDGLDEPSKNEFKNDNICEVIRNK